MPIISGLKVAAATIGNSATDTQNFQISSNNDGTMKIARKSDGSGGDILMVDSAGQLIFPSQITSASTTATVTNKIKIVVGGVTLYLLASTSGT